MSIPYILSDELRLRRVAVQTIVSGASTAISWDTEDVDTAGFITVPATTITIPTNRGGVYALTFQTLANTDLGAGRAFIEFLTSGIAYRQPFGTTENTGAVSVVIRLAAAATFDCNIFHSAGANRDFTARLEMHRLGS